MNLVVLAVDVTSLLMLFYATLRRRPFEDEEPERLEPEVDEAPLAVREVAAEAGAHHALPPRSVDRVKLLHRTPPKSKRLSTFSLPLLDGTAQISLTLQRLSSSRTDRER